MWTVKKIKEKKEFLHSQDSHVKRKKSLYISQVNIYMIIFFLFFSFLFEDETDSMLVLLTRYCMR